VFVEFLEFIGLMKQGHVEDCISFAENNSINTTNPTNPMNPVSQRIREKNYCY